MGDFQMTRAMAVVLLVAGSLVVIACGVATFLRYRKDDDDDEDDDAAATATATAAAGTDAEHHHRHRQNDRDDGRNPRGRAQSGGNRRTAADAGATCVAGHKIADADGMAAAGAGRPDGRNHAKSNAADAAEHRNGADGGGSWNGNAAGRGPPPAVVSCDGVVVPGGPTAAASPSRASPMSAVRAVAASNAYGVKTLQRRGSLVSSSPPPPVGLAQGQQPQSYHRNPDIIPAPLMSPAGTVYSNYGGQGKPRRTTRLKRPPR